MTETSSAQFPTRVQRGIVSFPGVTPQSKALVEKLLEADREKYHGMYGPGFHNHLSHHLLAAYDFGASATLLQTIYDAETLDLNPIDYDRATRVTEKQTVVITKENWTDYIGQEKYYASYLSFFLSEIRHHGHGKTLETFVFDPAANGNGSDMLLRFIAGAFHPMIQTGYGVEFGCDSVVAQGLALTAVHSVFRSPMFDCPSNEGGEALPLLEILRRVYDSPILKPVMPYDPNALFSARRKDACKDGRPEEIRDLASLWWSGSAKEDDITTKCEEIIWMATLLLVSTGKPGRKPRLDFFLMHVLNCTLFLPSLLGVLEKKGSQENLLKVLLSAIFLILEIRGRPRIDASLIMSYTDRPLPPRTSEVKNVSAMSIEEVNPWPAIVTDVLHAPDAHTVKAIRTLYYAAQRYGTTAVGDVRGIFRSCAEDPKEETHNGISALDGTVFVRAAGVIMNTMGWVTWGEKQGSWDRSALGWDDAWKD